MGIQENEISWQVLRRIVHEWAGTAAELAEVKPLVGGSISLTLELTTKDGARAVIKFCHHRVNTDFAREAHQLRLLKQIGLPVPDVYLVHTANLDNPDSYLLMEFVEGMDLHEAKKLCTPEQYDDLQRHLAELMIVMHQHTSTEYCRATCENGVTFQSWPQFYRSVYDGIWHDVERSGYLATKVKKQIGRVHERLERLIAHDDCPRLVHWDVWHANLLARPDADGKWKISALLDPNCKYAHAEAELAYMELFHTTTPAFIRAYQQHKKLGDAYHRVRKIVYQLYPLIADVHLFGPEYVKPLLAAVERTAPLV